MSQIYYRLNSQIGRFGRVDLKLYTSITHRNHYYIYILLYARAFFSVSVGEAILFDKFWLVRLAF